MHSGRGFGCVVISGDNDLEIKGLIWFDDIIGKIISKHNVQQQEVREVLDNDPQGDYMRKHKTSISEATSYKEIGEFWDTHDLSEFWDKTKEVSFEVDIESEVTYYAVDKLLSEEIQVIAQKRGVTADTLINLWVQEKLQEQKAS